MKIGIVLCSVMLLFSCKEFQEFKEFDTTCLEVAASVKKISDERPAIYIHNSLTLESVSNSSLHLNNKCTAVYELQDFYGLTTDYSSWNSFTKNYWEKAKRNRVRYAAVRISNRDNPKEYSERIPMQFTVNNQPLLDMNLSHIGVKDNVLSISKHIFSPLDKLKKKYTLSIVYEFVDNQYRQQLGSLANTKEVSSSRDLYFEVPYSKRDKYFVFGFKIKMEGSVYTTSVLNTSLVQQEANQLFSSIKKVDTLLFSNPTLAYDFSQFKNFGHTYYGSGKYSYSTNPIGSYQLLSFTRWPSDHKNKSVDYTFVVYDDRNHREYKLNKSIHFYDLDGKIKDLIQVDFVQNKSSIQNMKITYSMPDFLKQKVNYVNMNVNLDDSYSSVSHKDTDPSRVNDKSFYFNKSSYFDRELHKLNTTVSYTLKNGQTVNHYDKRYVLYNWSHYISEPYTSYSQMVLRYDFEDIHNKKQMDNIELYIKSPGASKYSSQKSYTIRNSYIKINNLKKGDYTFYYKLNFRNNSRALYSGIYTYKVER